MPVFSTRKASREDAQSEACSWENHSCFLSRSVGENAAEPIKAGEPREGKFKFVTRNRLGRDFYLGTVRAEKKGRKGNPALACFGSRQGNADGFARMGEDGGVVKKEGDQIPEEEPFMNGPLVVAGRPVQVQGRKYDPSFAPGEGDHAGLVVFSSRKPDFAFGGVVEEISVHVEIRRMGRHGAEGPVRSGDPGGGVLAALVFRESVGGHLSGQNGIFFPELLGESEEGSSRGDEFLHRVPEGLREAPVGQGSARENEQPEFRKGLAGVNRLQECRGFRSAEEGRRSPCVPRGKDRYVWCLRDCLQEIPVDFFRGSSLLFGERSLEGHPLTGFRAL